MRRRRTGRSDSGGAVVGLSAQYMALWYGKLLLLLLAISSFVSALGTANFTTRVAFSWGHDGYLPRAFGRTHPRFRSPDVAIAALGVCTATVFIAGLPGRATPCNGGLTFFSWLLQVRGDGNSAGVCGVGIAGVVHSRRTAATIVIAWLPPLLAVVVVVAGEVTEFYKQRSSFTGLPYVMLGWIASRILVRLATRKRVAKVEQAEQTQAEMTAGTPAV